MYQLESEDALGRKMVFPLVKSKTTIGREPSCDIVLEDEEVSRQHAIIGIVGQAIKLRDYNSTNGVFVNNQRITEMADIKVGDEIIIGANMFRLREGEGTMTSAEQERTVAVSAEDLAAEIHGAAERQATDAATGLSLGSSSSSAWNATLALDKDAIMKAIYRKQLNLHRYNSLEVVSGPDKGKRYLLKKGELLIGRGANCNIQLSDPRTSKEHGRISVTNAGVTYTDRGSANGSKINGEPATTAELHNRDLLELGFTQLKCIIPKERSAKPATDPEPSSPTASHPTFSTTAAKSSPPPAATSSTLKEYLVPLIIGIGVAVGVVALLVLLGR